MPMVMKNGKKGWAFMPFMGLGIGRGAPGPYQLRSS